MEGGRFANESKGGRKERQAHPPRFVSFRFVLETDFVNVEAALKGVLEEQGEVFLDSAEVYGDGESEVRNVLSASSEEREREMG